MAPWGLSDGDDVDADLKALKAAAPLAKKRKKAGAKSAGDTYGARESCEPVCRAVLRVAADPSTSIARTQVDRSGRRRKGTRRRCRSSRRRIASLTQCRKTPTTGTPSSGPSMTVPTRATRNKRPRRTSPTPPRPSLRLRANSRRRVSAASCCSSCRSRCLPRRVPRCVFALSLVPISRPLQQICSHFELRDLVCIAKTSKKLHEILLARNARSIWARCRERMGYILPQDISEIQFALFIAGESCQVRRDCSTSDLGQPLRDILLQHCGSACDTYVAFLFTWMVRFCCGCRHSQ